MGLTAAQSMALDTKKNIALTANAGTGKTTVLTARYLKLALDDEIPVKKIVAITFTDLAAGKLYADIAEAINKELEIESEKAEVDGNRIKKLEKLRREIIYANVSTIHSFCLNILRNFPIEAKLDYNFTPIDETTSKEIFEEIYENFLEKKISNDESRAEITLLLQFAKNKDSLLNIFKELLSKRSNVLKFEKHYKDEESAVLFYKSVRDKYLDLVYSNQEIDAYAAAYKECAVLLNEEGKRGCFHLADQIIAEKDIVKKVNLLTSCKHFASIKFDLRLKIFRPFKDSAKIVRDFKIIDESDNNQTLVKFAVILFKYFKELCCLNDEIKKEKNFVDFEDILLITAGLVDNEKVKEYITQKYTHLMIDEYQDTNHLQYDIFKSILDNLNTGNLFIVGDDKQGIYGFRNADIKVFDETKSDIRAAEGLDLLIPDNFRLAKELCFISNSIFENVFSSPDKRFGEVNNSNLIFGNTNLEKGETELLFVEDPVDQAEEIAKKILFLKKQNNWEWNDFAILSRKRSFFSQFEEAFTRYSIPFSVQKGSGFFENHEVRDILNYLKFLYDPSNDQALAAVLKSPFFYFSDYDLLKISSLIGFTLWQKLKNYEDTKAQEVISIISENIILFSTLNINEIIRRIISQNNYLARVTKGYNGSQVSSNIYKLLNDSLQFIAQGFKTVYDLIEFIKDKISSGDNDEANGEVLENDNSVSIMTVHAAKGLQFKAVFIVYIDSKNINNKTPNFMEETGLIFKTPIDMNFQSDYAKNIILEIASKIESGKQWGELKRLFYVAFTRARNYCCLSGYHAKSAGMSFYSLLKDFNEIDVETEKISLDGTIEIIGGTSENIHVEIPVFKTFDIEAEIVDTEEKKYEINLFDIKDIPKHEIYSATGLSIYNFCPQKYELTNELYFSKLNDLFNNGSGEIMLEEKTEETDDEPSSISRSQIKGKLLHSVLQLEDSNNYLQNMEIVLPEILKDYDSSISNDFIEEVKLEAAECLTGYYKSENYQYIKDAKIFYNEFEILAKSETGNYFLQGYLDKLIVEDDKLIIVDYKSNKVEKSRIDDLISYYKQQLYFYAYISSKLFPADRVELRIILLNYPDKIFSEILDITMIEAHGRHIESVVSSIRRKEFIKNIDNCLMCNFAINGNCIKK